MQEPNIPLTNAAANTPPEGAPGCPTQTPPAAGGYGQAVAVPPYVYAIPLPEQKKKSRRWIVGLAAVAALFLLGVLAINSCSALFSESSMLSGLYGIDQPVSEDSVAIITIDGTIQYDYTTSSPEGLQEKLKEAQENDHIKAVVLRIDSGGGTATAGEEMAEYVKRFEKPVVVSSASINASAAYMISSQADYIFTGKTSSIGSIGVAMQLTDLSGLYEKLGINIENIVSSESKDSSYGTRGLTEEEQAYYQAMVDQINDMFIQTVAEGRAGVLTEDEVRELATGLSFTGVDAVENGLADEIGTVEDAVEKAAALAEVEDYEVVYLDKTESSGSDLLDLLYGEDKGSVSLLERILLSGISNKEIS